jgi:hypothetical protein
MFTKCSEMHRLCPYRPRRKLYPYDEAVAEAFLARLRAGERINDLLGKSGMPSQRAYRHWRRTEAGFAGELERLRGLRYRRRSGSGHGRWRAFDAAVADRIYIAVLRGAVLRRVLAGDPALPCLAVTERWRRENPEWDKMMRFAMRIGRRAPARRNLTPGLIEEIAGRIVEGGSLRSIGAERDMPCPRTLYAWVARHPHFAAEVARACAIREDWFNDQMLDICERNGPLGLARTKRQAAGLQRQLNRLAKRPGWKRARAEREADEVEGASRTPAGSRPR